VLDHHHESHLLFSLFLALETELFHVLQKQPSPHGFDELEPVGFQLHVFKYSRGEKSGLGCCAQARIRFIELPKLALTSPTTFRKSFANWMASSLEFARRIANPPTSSFASVKGPSVTVKFPLELRTRAPSALGRQPSVPNRPSCLPRQFSHFGYLFLRRGSGSLCRLINAQEFHAVFSLFEFGATPAKRSRSPETEPLTAGPETQPLLARRTKNSEIDKLK
jgi:hypothetical protein